VAFLTDDNIEDALVAMLKLESAADLPDYAPEVIPKAHAAGYNEIVRRLSARGFTAAQIAAWDSGDEFERDLSLFWCLVKMATLRANLDQTVFQALDRRAELKDVPVTNGNVALRPSGGIASVGRGDMNQSTEGQFWYETGSISRDEDRDIDVSKTPW
jgi:hypothetical protein